MSRLEMRRGPQGERASRTLQVTKRCPPSCSVAPANEYERMPVPPEAQRGWLSFISIFVGRHTAGTEFSIVSTQPMLFALALASASTARQLQPAARTTHHGCSVAPGTTAAAWRLWQQRRKAADASAHAGPSLRGPRRYAHRHHLWPLSRKHPSCSLLALCHDANRNEATPHHLCGLRARRRTVRACPEPLASRNDPQPGRILCVAAPFPLHERFGPSKTTPKRAELSARTLQLRQKKKLCQSVGCWRPRSQARSPGALSQEPWRRRRRVIIVYDLVAATSLALCCGAMFTVSGTALGVLFDVDGMPGLEDWTPTSPAFCAVVIVSGAFTTLISAFGMK